ncbi:MAG: GFA family protein [Burkholderiales bacterium]
MDILPAHQGGCHCSTVRFEIRSSLARITECNCSICTKKGVLLHRVDAERFKLLSGADALGLYQFGTNRAQHLFCKRCGIHSFSRPRAAPDAYAVNVRCLDGYPDVVRDAATVHFDGQHWEEAVQGFQFR